MEKTIKNCVLTVNGGKVFVREEHPGEYLSYLFMSVLNLQYWSFEALKHFYYENVELIIEYCIIRREELCGSRKAIFTRFISYGNDSLLQRTFKDRHAVLVCVYNLVLKSEGLGFLRGFGIKDHEGKKLMGNPEYSSIINIKSERGEEDKKVVNQKQIIFNKRKESKMGNVKFGDLKKAIQALNEMDHIEENIRYVGVKKDVLVELFLEGVDASPGEEPFSKNVVSMYDFLDGDLRKVIRTLNKMDYIEKDIDVGSLDRDGLTKVFIEGVDACPEEDEENLPEVVVAMYNELTKTLAESDICKKDDDNGQEEKGQEKEECLDFGKGHGKDKDKCGECKEEYPEDYDGCKKLSKPKKTVAKKKIGKAKTKKVEGKKTEAKKKGKDKSEIKKVKNKGIGAF
ncbi:hypothetical protein LCGC14_1767850, partial [marine sediment metagenome]